MRQIRAFGLFWWDFIVGDDYRLAAGVVVLLGLTALLTRAGIAVWWLPPLGVLGLLAASVLSAAAQARRTGASRPSG